MPTFAKHGDSPAANIECVGARGSEGTFVGVLGWACGAGGRDGGGGESRGGAGGSGVVVIGGWVIG